MKPRTSRKGLKDTKGRLVTFVARPRYELDDLLKGVTPKAMHEAYDWGPDRGREIVDE